MSYLKKTFLAALIALAVVGCSQQNGGQNFDTQIAISDQGFATLSQLDWAGYTGQVHPDGLVKFQAMLMPGIEKMVMGTPADSINLFGKFYKSEVIQSMAPAEFFTEIMTMVAEVSPEIKTTFSQMQNTAIGGVAENDSLVHIMIKTSMSIGGRAIEEMNIQSVVKTGDEWKLVMSPKIDGIGLMLANALPR